MPRKKAETTPAKAQTKQANKNVRYKVQVKDEVIILKNRALLAHGGYVIVNEDEFSQLKEMGIVPNG